MTTTIPSFPCCQHLHDDSPAGLNRRRFIQLAALGGGAALLGLATPWRLAQAEAGHGTAKSDAAPAAHGTEALLLSCMDYRLIDDMVKYMDGRGLTDQYDHVILAGASLGALTSEFKDWNKTFWEHLKISIDLHHINRVIVMDHRDCGAYKVILKADFAKDPTLEENVHAKYLRDLKQAIQKTYPKLEVETLLMNLDGTVQTVPEPTA
ncbi:MAG: twin-arginine translocation signal domain-containing protein [Candidatus Competibacteraceae bacterium]|nr:twin-arginine translocation signal domain-containing protein [Candidatus Competibacteraceae bacterium]MCP5126762.1 twin-arginine translocation signal domain-containing protein [Gammaproteobacteria bacterium]HRX71060.1 twin-arginine translocation signal domain-containing protein [Candidatus Competibacteraceae bacterium]